MDPEEHSTTEEEETTQPKFQYSPEQVAHLDALEAATREAFPPSKEVYYNSLDDLRRQMRAFAEAHGFSIGTHGQSLRCSRGKVTTSTKRRRERLDRENPHRKRRNVKNTKCDCPFFIRFCNTAKGPPNAVRITENSCYRHDNGCLPSRAQLQETLRSAGAYSRDIRPHEWRGVLEIMRGGNHVPAKVLRPMMKSMYPPDYKITPADVANMRHRLKKWLEKNESGEETATEPQPEAAPKERPTFQMDPTLVFPEDTNHQGIVGIEQLLKMMERAILQKNRSEGAIVRVDHLKMEHPLTLGTRFWIQGTRQTDSSWHMSVRGEGAEFASARGVHVSCHLANEVTLENAATFSIPVVVHSDDFHVHMKHRLPVASLVTWMGRVTSIDLGGPLAVKRLRDDHGLVLRESSIERLSILAGDHTCQAGSTVIVKSGLGVTDETQIESRHVLWTQGHPIAQGITRFHVLNADAEVQVSAQWPVWLREKCGIAGSG